VVGIVNSQAYSLVCEALLAPVETSPSCTVVYAVWANLICANQAILCSCDVCRSRGSVVPWIRAWSGAKRLVSPLCHSCVILLLSSLVGILSMPLLSWSISFRCFQIIQPNSHSARVRFLAQNEALFHCRGCDRDIFFLRLFEVSGCAS
jgi:hypothetical protein